MTDPSTPTVPLLPQGDPEEKTRQIFRYIFFSQDSIAQRRKVLDAFVLRACPPCMIQCGACSKIKKLVDNTGDIPSYDFAISDLGLTHAVTQADKELSFPEAMATVELEREERIKQNLTYRLLEISQKTDEMDFDETRIELTKVTTLLTQGTKSLEHRKPSDIYKARLNLPAGLLTFVRPIDELIGGIEAGTMMTLLGFTGHFKTTAAVNMLYNNCVVNGYNIAYFTMEVPKELLTLALLSRHSYNSKFSAVHAPVKADALRKNTLEDDEREFLFEVVEPDLYQNPDYGKFFFLENSDFEAIDVPNISAALGELSLDAGSSIDCLVADYLQLFQYLPTPPNVPRNLSVGDYFVREFAELAKNCNGERIAVILLSQANRQGHQRAVDNKGKYDLQALAEFHELERSSSYVMYTFTDEYLKESNEVLVGLLKNRFGATMEDPITTLVEPAYYVFGEEQGGYSDVTDAQSLDIYLDI